MINLIFVCNRNRKRRGAYLIFDMQLFIFVALIDCMQILHPIDMGKLLPFSSRKMPPQLKNSGSPRHGVSMHMSDI